ncbi:MAG: hypothetical protein M3Y41_06570, partial [Pseudomonadota bacterium]|nr:hypothetical protein [Pseudomonadota bacterium]
QGTPRRSREGARGGFLPPPIALEAGRGADPVGPTRAGVARGHVDADRHHGPREKLPGGLPDAGCDGQGQHDEEAYHLA